MLIESRPIPSISWKDKLLGVDFDALNKKRSNYPGDCTDKELEFLKGNVHRSMVNGIPSIDFSERIQKILFKKMELTIVLKLLEKNIGYGALHSRVCSLWSPSKPFHLMYIENGGLLGFLYKKKILEEIGETVGKVVRLDLNTDNRTRGRFARMAIYVNLEKPLIAQVIVNGLPQKVVYEGLPTICYTCERYGYSKEFCSSLQSKIDSGKDQAEVSPVKVLAVENVTFTSLG
ncbi:hypothetical protein PVK06_035902 [Gossypium arboreum]|uniref:DUF4283 domain-containing protein n=1 Tax=Gossypium arboreum TaxID=29729 RepID=A0ABR0NI12_GOSAR|nr:hypothetical protein PVK06_035902 [Gossypium arboreum]